MIAAQFLIAIHVFFSPNGGGQQAAIAAIESAQKSIELSAYSYTSQPIDDAIIAAEKRGVAVRAILDAGANAHNKGSKRVALAASGAEVVCDFAHPIAHSKIIVIDDATVVTGSFNFSLQAEQHNAENLLVIDDPDLAAQYVASFEHHHTHAKACGPMVVKKAAKK